MKLTGEVNMSALKKVALGLLVFCAVFSGSARTLLSLAANAVESTALAGDRDGGGGASCG
jgi:hypothetical protein